MTPGATVPLVYGDSRLPARFWSKVRVNEATGCWEWFGARVSGGYGHVAVNGRPRGVHRAAYEALVGTIPAGLHIDHLCRNPPCCNPAHLEPVTSRVNTMRGVGLTAQHAAKTVCLRGHDITGANAYTRPSAPGERECKVCRAYRSRRLYWKRRGVTLP